MSVVSIGLDLAKSVFQVHGVDAFGRAVLRRKLARGELIAFFTKQPRWWPWRHARAPTIGLESLFGLGTTCA